MALSQSGRRRKQERGSRRQYVKEEEHVADDDNEIVKTDEEHRVGGSLKELLDGRWLGRNVEHCEDGQSSKFR